jgi:hypothetical protein
MQKIQLTDEILFLNKRKKRSILILAKYSLNPGYINNISRSERELVFFLQDNQFYIGIRYKIVLSDFTKALYRKAGINNGVSKPIKTIKEDNNNQKWKWEFRKPLEVIEDEFRHEYWFGGIDLIDFAFIIDENQCIISYGSKTLRSGKYGNGKFTDNPRNAGIVMTKLEFKLLTTKVKSLIKKEDSS